MSKPIVVLFDVDGTLVHSEGAGRRAVVAAFEALHGRRDAIDGLSLGGMTDRAIMRLGLEAIGAEVSAEQIDILIARYLRMLGPEVDRAGACRALPGVVEAVNACLSSSGLATGLGTGNVKEGARIKLQAAGLDGHFEFGGYGCDSEVRSELLHQGAARGAVRLKRQLSDCEVVVIGDTPRDVAAALAIGASCVGVATGSFGMDELHEAGADHVFPDLLAPGVISAIRGAT